MSFDVENSETSLGWNILLEIQMLDGSLLGFAVVCETLACVAEHSHLDEVCAGGKLKAALVEKGRDGFLVAGCAVLLLGGGQLDEELLGSLEYE